MAEWKPSPPHLLKRLSIFQVSGNPTFSNNSMIASACLFSARWSLTANTAEEASVKCAGERNRHPLLPCLAFLIPIHTQKSRLWHLWTGCYIHPDQQLMRVLTMQHNFLMLLEAKCEDLCSHGRDWRAPDTQDHEPGTSKSDAGKGNACRDDSILYELFPSNRKRKQHETTTIQNRDPLKPDSSFEHRPQCLRETFRSVSLLAQSFHLAYESTWNLTILTLYQQMSPFSSCIKHEHDIQCASHCEAQPSEPPRFLPRRRRTFSSFTSSLNSSSILWTWSASSWLTCTKIISGAGNTFLEQHDYF